MGNQLEPERPILHIPEGCSIAAEETTVEDQGFVVISISSEVDSRTERLQESVDSGYDEPENREQCAKQLSPDCVPCRTDQCLGEHHSAYGHRHIQYDSESDEGNRHITDEDL